PIIFLDEPTASLSAADSARLFQRLMQIRQEGVAIVYVSHRLDEVLRLADRITILRDGRVVDTGARGTFDRDGLIRAMIGRAVESSPIGTGVAAAGNVLVTENLSDASGRFRDVSLQLRAGEIVTLYGLVGAGRSELAAALVGLRRATGKM